MGLCNASIDNYCIYGLEGLGLTLEPLGLNLGQCRLGLCLGPCSFGLDLGLQGIGLGFLVLPTRLWSIGNMLD